MHTGWIAQVRSHGVLAVGQALGLGVIRRRSLAPCPSCGRTQRGRTDPRGPIGIRRDNAGWTCHRCDAQGDAVTLAAWLVEGCPRPSNWQDVRAACKDVGLCDGAGRSRPLPQPVPDVPNYPPPRETRALWQECRPVTEDPEVASWLSGRGLKPDLIAASDLARALPKPCARLPRWAAMNRRMWVHSSHRVLLRFFAANGNLATLHARAVHHDATPKGLSPAGFTIQGTVMADRAGWQLLRSGHSEHRLLIAEGVPDFLTWAQWAANGNRQPPAVLGVISGSWSDPIAARIPSGTRVLIRTHDDPAGHKYADAITASLSERCTVLRRVPNLD